MKPCMNFDGKISRGHVGRDACLLFRRPLRRQRGFSLVTTLFLLLVVSSLAAYMVNLATVQHLSSAMASQSARALYMAVSGLEWVTAEIRSNPGNCPSVPTSFQTDGFTITLDACLRSAVTEAGSTYSLYDISVGASQGSFGETGYVSRSLRATVME